MAGWVRLVRGGALLALAVGAYFVVPVHETVDQDAAVRLVFAILTICLLTGVILWQLARQRGDPDARVDGLVLALVVAILAFALGFYRMAVTDPSEIVDLHTRVDALYFTMSTLLTIGYGDVHAVGQAARGVVLVQMVFDVVVIATAATTLSSQIRRRAAARADRRLRREGGRDDGAGPRPALGPGQQPGHARGRDGVRGPGLDQGLDQGLGQGRVTRRNRGR